MPALRIHSESNEEGMATTANFIPTRKPNIWASLEAARRAQSLLRQSDTRQRSSSSRSCRLSQVYFRDLAAVPTPQQERACERRTASWSPLRAHSRYRVTVPRRVYDETFLEERGKCDVRDRPSAGPSASATRSATQSVTRGRGSSCKVTVTMRRFLSTAAVCCWLLVALGVGQVSTQELVPFENFPLKFRRFKRAPEITRMCRQTASRETCQELGPESKFVIYKYWSSVRWRFFTAEIALYFILGKLF